MHVFERACKACTGTGSISSNSRGRRRTASYVCTICHGLGQLLMQTQHVTTSVWALALCCSEHMCTQMPHASQLQPGINTSMSASVTVHPSQCSLNVSPPRLVYHMPHHNKAANAVMLMPFVSAVTSWDNPVCANKSCNAQNMLLRPPCIACMLRCRIAVLLGAGQHSELFASSACYHAGYVRHTSSRFMPPNLNNGSGDFTIGRPVPPPPDEDDKKRKYRSLRR